MNFINRTRPFWFSQGNSKHECLQSIHPIPVEPSYAEQLISILARPRAMAQLGWRYRPDSGCRARSAFVRRKWAAVLEAQPVRLAPPPASLEPRTVLAEVA
jgi:hypothetical protein